jgi:hypothetical protein
LWRIAWHIRDDFMKLLPSEVSEDTYRILSLLEVTPERIEIPATVEKHKRALSWMAERGFENAELVAFSGEADPRIWNAVEEKLGEALGKGMKYTHIVGPVVCTDETGKNAILELRKEYPRSVKLYLTRTRKPYHWSRFTSKVDGAKQLFFRLFGECHHEPLAAIRKGYSIWLEENTDPFMLDKIAYWYNRERDYVWLKPIMDEVTDPDKVPTLTMRQIKIVCQKMRHEGLDFDLETGRKITSYLQ